MGLGGAGSKSPGCREALGPDSWHCYPRGDETARADHTLEPTHPRAPPVAATHQLPGLLAALCPGQGAPVDTSLGGSPGLQGAAFREGEAEKRGPAASTLGSGSPLSHVATAARRRHDSHQVTRLERGQIHKYEPALRDQRTVSSHRLGPAQMVH